MPTSRQGRCRYSEATVTCTRTEEVPTAISLAGSQTSAPLRDPNRSTNLPCSCSPASALRAKASAKLPAGAYPLCRGLGRAATSRGPSSQLQGVVPGVLPSQANAVRIISLFSLNLACPTTQSFELLQGSPRRVVCNLAGKIGTLRYRSHQSPLCLMGSKSNTWFSSSLVNCGSGPSILVTLSPASATKRAPTGIHGPQLRHYTSTVTIGCSDTVKKLSSCQNSTLARIIPQLHLDFLSTTSSATAICQWQTRVNYLPGMGES